MEGHKFIAAVLEGKMRSLSFDNVAAGLDNGVTTGILSALNFARLAFVAAGSTPLLSKMIELLSPRTIVENALGICREWPGGVHLEVEDVYHVPLFEVPLRLVATDYNSPSPDHIAALLEEHRTPGSSAAILVTRYPTVVVCLRLRTSTQHLFVLFNLRVTSEHGRVASLAFCTSLPQIVQQLCDIFPLDKVPPTRGNPDQQAKFIGKFTGHVFTPRDSSHDPHSEEESLLVSSLTLLTLRAELEELTHDNESLKQKKQRLERSVVDLGAQLEAEKIKTKSAQSSESSRAIPTHGLSISLNRGPQVTQSSRSTAAREDHLNTDDMMDPNMMFALQLQATFDSENELLLRQRHDLMQTAQRQYHCGVCLDDFPEDDAVQIGACGHQVCRDCARGHVCVKIEEHRFPVLCPVCMADNRKQDPGTISGTLVQLLGVSEKQWETWVEMEMAQFSIPFTCRQCHHSGFIDRQDLDAQSEIHCPFPACNYVWCKKCQQAIDSNGPKHSCDGTSELDHLMKQQGWRYCPNCKTPIQKIQGCNHLSCIAPGCNTHFCYRCGETINRTAIPREIQEGKMAHFRTCALH